MLLAMVLLVGGMRAKSGDFPPNFAVGAGGGASLYGFASLSSTFAGRHSLTQQHSQDGWSSLIVDRSVQGVVAVRAVATTFTLERRYIAAGSRVLINDTFTCTAKTNNCPIYTNHTITLLSAATVRLNGGFDAPQLGECMTNLVRGTNGNPSVVASSDSGGGFGVMPLDDVFRTHGYMVNRATPTRIPKHAPCTISNPPAFDVVDAYLALSPGQRYTAEWAIYAIEKNVPPLEVPWVFLNRLRADLGVNNITLLGGATVASWETEILGVGNWSHPGCNASGSLHDQSAVCFPTWDDSTLHSFLAYQGTGLVVSNIMRMEHGWPRCEDNATRDYCYGSCGTAMQYSNWTQTYLHRLVSSLKRVHFGGKALLYLHPFISTEKGAAQKYAADRQLASNGAQVCDYSGEYVGTTTNDYGAQLLEFVALAMDNFGFDGIYLDESSYGVTPLDYSPLRSDGHSAIIDMVTFEITAHVSFVPLVWQGLQARIYDEVVAKRGGTMVANSFPVTRTAMEAGIRNNVVQFVESSAKGREVWGQLYTPVALSKALFQLSDYDPHYANVSGLPVDNLWADLDFGTLTYMYDMLLPNVSGWNAPKANVMQHIFPTTPTELGPGYIIGQERIVTKVARRFSFAAPAPKKLHLRYFDRQGWLESSALVPGPEVDVAVDGGGVRSFAVVTAGA
jgi:hypothetical protein